MTYEMQLRVPDDSCEYKDSTWYEGITIRAGCAREALYVASCEAADLGLAPWDWRVR